MFAGVQQCAVAKDVLNAYMFSANHRACSASELVLSLFVGLSALLAAISRHWLVLVVVLCVALAQTQTTFTNDTTTVMTTPDNDNDRRNDCCDIGNETVATVNNNNLRRSCGCSKRRTMFVVHRDRGVAAADVRL